MIEIPLGWLRVLAVAVPVLALTGAAAYVRRRRSVAAAIGDPGLIRHLIGDDLTRIPWIRLSIIGLGVASLAAALLDPALATPRSRAGGPVVLVLDASGSMLAEDVDGPRLALQQRIARSIVEPLSDRPVGIVAFAGRAFSLTPPTRDRGALEMYLATLHPSIVTQSGSALGAAIRQGIGLLGAGDGRSGGTLVLIGDGDETDDPEAAVEAAALARRSGVVVHAVGVGGDLETPVPAFDLATGTTSGYLRGDDGEILLTRRDERLLREIATAGGGIYVGAEQPDAVARIIDELVDVAAAAPANGEQRIPTYAWLGLASFFLLLLEPVTLSFRPESAASKRGREQ